MAKTHRVFLALTKRHPEEGILRLLRKRFGLASLEPAFSYALRYVFLEVLSLGCSKRRCSPYPALNYTGAGEISWTNIRKLRGSLEAETIHPIAKASGLSRLISSMNHPKTTLQAKLLAFGYIGGRGGDTAYFCPLLAGGRQPGSSCMGLPKKAGRGTRNENSEEICPKIQK